MANFDISRLHGYLCMHREHQGPQLMPWRWKMLDETSFFSIAWSEKIIPACHCLSLPPDQMCSGPVCLQTERIGLGNGQCLSKNALLCTSKDYVHVFRRPLCITAAGQEAAGKR